MTTAARRVSSRLLASASTPLQTAGSDVAQFMQTGWPAVGLAGSHLHLQRDSTKGLCLMTTVAIARNDFVIEYAGEIYTATESRRILARHDDDEEAGAYMFKFRFRERSYVIDSVSPGAGYRPGQRLAVHETVAASNSNQWATAGYGVARYINHSSKRPNLTVSVFNSYHEHAVTELLPPPSHDGRRAARLAALHLSVQQFPRLVFVAMRDIAAGEELLFDYGMRDPAYPWLKDS